MHKQSHSHGRGQVGAVLMMPSRTYPVDAFLYRFDIDSAVVKPRHQEFLKQQVVPILDGGGSVTLVGMASRTGRSAYNQDLSLQRAQAIEVTLRQLSKSNFRTNKVSGDGDAMAAAAGLKPGTESEMHRAVEVIVSKHKEPPVPPPPPPVPVTERKATDWQVYGRKQAAVGFTLAGGLFEFDFYSYTAGVSATMGFAGAGIGLGGDFSGSSLPHPDVKLNERASVSNWSSLEVVTPFSISDLDGAYGHISSAGAGLGVGFSLTYIAAARSVSGFSGRLFDSSNVSGYSVGGAGGGAFSVGGKWAFLNIGNNRPRNPYEM